MNDVELGLVVRAIRRRLGLRQLDVARRADVHRSTVGLLELGGAGQVSLDLTRRIMNALGGRVDVRPMWRGPHLEGCSTRITRVSLRRGKRGSSAGAGWLVPRSATADTESEGASTCSRGIRAAGSWPWARSRRTWSTRRTCWAARREGQARADDRRGRWMARRGRRRAHPALQGSADRSAPRGEADAAVQPIRHDRTRCNGLAASTDRGSPAQRPAHLLRLVTWRRDPRRTDGARAGGRQATTDERRGECCGPDERASRGTRTVQR